MGISMVLVRAMAAAVSHAGADTAAFLRAAGFDVEQLEDSSARVDLAHYDRVQELALDHTGDEALGLHLGERTAPFMFGTAGALSSQCHTLREACQLLSAYFGLLSDTPGPSLDEEGGSAFLQFPFIRSTPRVDRLRTELALSAFLACGRALLGRPDMRVDEVWFEHERPSYADEYTRIFGEGVYFGRAKTGFVLSSELLDTPGIHRDPELFRLLRAEADRMLEATRGGPMAERVRALVSYSNDPRRPGMTEVARSLGISVRTLRRRLEEEGRSFRDVVDDAQRDRALRLLRDRTLTAADVADRAGFSDVSALYRAVKRWTSLTVKQVRST
jgi:AraC-like DNA-binding protein